MINNPLVGTWRLVSFEVRDEAGHVAHPLGHDAAGFITYTTDGHMAVQFGPINRAPLDAGDWLASTDAEIVAAARGYFAYCGTYEVGDGKVLHRVTMSLVPNWIGGEQVRFFAMSEDTVTLSTPTMRVDGRQQVATLVWQRA